MLTPRIETKSSKVLVGLHGRFLFSLTDGTAAGEVVGPLWGRLHQRLSEVEAVEVGVFYGCSYYGPADRREHPDEVEYVAGVERTPGSEVPDGMVSMETPAGLYAVFEHRGPMTTYHDTLRAIYGAWLPNSQFQGNGKADVELYDARWSPTSEDSVLEYWLGIEPRA